MIINKNGKEVVLGQVTSFKMPKIKPVIKTIETINVPNWRTQITMQISFAKNTKSLIERAKRQIAFIRLQSQLYGG